MSMADGTAPVVSINNFSISFGDKKVVKDLSFDVYQGEVFGFLGSNGSGKTTTLRCLLGIYKPDHGELLINGKPFDISTNNNIGYLPEERGIYKKEKVIDTMIYFGRLKGMTKADARKFSLDFLERVGLANHARINVDKLSGGQQQKVQIGIAIMNDPSLLILDEPTKGFDPVNRRLLLNIIMELRRRGTSVIMVSHQMDEVEKLCDRILMLKDGVACEYGTVAEVKSHHGGASIDDIFLKIYGAIESTNDSSAKDIIDIAKQHKEVHNG